MMKSSRLTRHDMTSTWCDIHKHARTRARPQVLYEAPALKGRELADALVDAKGGWGGVEWSG